MRQLTLYVLLSLAVSFAVAAAQSVGASPVPLLPGYTHRSEPGIDSIGGEIWKPNGPSISYDISIGSFGGDVAGAYAQQFPKSATIRLRTPREHSFVIVMDEEHDAMIVSVDRANFSAKNVKSRRDVAEVLAIVRMYELNAELRR